MTRSTDTTTPGRARPFGPDRIAALVLVGLAVLVLAYLRFGPDDGTVSVPKGAHAGDLILKRSSYDTEKGSYVADVGTLVVPENRADPSSRLIALPVTRVRARSEHPREPIFRLEGGPGVSNMSFSKASRFADDRDVVLVGYRGVDGSVRLDCPEVESAFKHSTDMLAESAHRDRADAFRACADRLRDDGVDLAGYSLPQRVDDLEAVRKALGYGRIDVVSESAGTRTAMIWAWRYPASIHRSVMIGVNPPGHFVWDAKTSGEQVRRYAALCEADNACRGRTSDLAGSLHSATGHIPRHWWFLPIKEGNVRAAAFWGLMHATTNGGGPLTAGWTIDTLLHADQGDGAGAWFLSVIADMAFPSAQVWGDAAAVARTDAAAARRFFARGEGHGSVLGSPGTDLIWAGGKLLDAWPARSDENEYARVRDSKVETLLINGELDFATPPQWATRDLLPHLPNGQEVVLRNTGHTGDFWASEPDKGTRLIETYLDTGRVDRSLVTRKPVDFTPTVGHGGIAMIVLGVMLGVGALAALSLLLMWLRVRWRGGFGRKSSAVLRSLYPVVLGLGGWFVGALVVITATPGSSLDNELLAPLAVGVPVGLGVYLAWVDRDWSGTTKSTGVAAAAGGAVLGGWFGFQASADLVALFTTIVGAIAGANLLLLALDIAWNRHAGDRAAAVGRGRATARLNGVELVDRARRRLNGLCDDGLAELRKNEDGTSRYITQEPT
jgi:pimeloyl-ACP methyl ester carboxylesterase